MSTNIRILIADDDDGYRFPIRNLFEDNDYQVAEAKSHSELLERAPEADVWVIDARLPTGQMEGIQAVVDLAERNVKPKYPVLFISVIPEENARDKLEPLKRQGIRYEWIEKPFELELLLKKVQRLR